MELKRLEWDSTFFKHRIFSVRVSSEALPSTATLKQALREQDAELAYIFVQEPAPAWQQELTAAGACLYDEKLTYGKSAGNFSGMVNAGVKEYKGAANEDLLQLAILAGHESRFKKDPGLQPHFEALYKLWLTKSLDGSMADKVFIYTASDRIDGMVTCKIKGDTGIIGLIATSPASQGKGIGSFLLDAVENYYKDNGVLYSDVVTQQSNNNACRFYEKAGFSVKKLEHVYHWWLK